MSDHVIGHLADSDIKMRRKAKKDANQNDIQYVTMIYSIYEKKMYSMF